MPSVPRTDVGLAVLLTVTGLLEVALTDLPEAEPVRSTLLALGVAATMLVRTARPAVCLGLTVSLVVVAELPEIGLTLTGTLVVGCLLAVASVGRRCRDRVSLAGLVTTLSIFVVGAAFGGRPWDVVVALLACGAAWGAGRLLRRESQRSEHLSSLAADLVTHREVRAEEAVQAERIRLARELHDTVAHTVSVMTLQVGGVRRRLDGDVARREERDVLIDVEALGREAVVELHRMLGVLRPAEECAASEQTSALSPQPRLSDLQRLAARVRAAGVPVEIELAGAPRPLSAGLELVAYRVVQEGLTNVLKHSPGSPALVRVTFGGESLELLVEDEGTNGPGMLEERSGLGLRGIRERVALYGGQVEAGPVDRGFRIVARLPLDGAGVLS